MMLRAGIEQKEYILRDINESQNLAKKIAQSLKPSDVIALHGDLGSGKTFFCREIIRELMQDPSLNVVSPTYNLLQTYQLTTCTIYHYDLYRIKDQSEFDELGIDDALRETNICLIEWPELIIDILPKKSMHIYLNITENDQRLCIVK